MSTNLVFINLNVLDSFLANGHEPLFITLANDANETHIQVEL